MSGFAPATVVVYDAECRFCIRSLRVLKAFDILGRITLVPSNEDGLLERFPSLRGADFASAMYAVRDGKAYAGFDAFRTALWSSPILALLAWSWYVPPVPALGRRVYAWIARNRRSLGCSLES
jgi:predicted DCC family thiol-disulfide oxidoreductase YuxK